MDPEPITTLAHSTTCLQVRLRAKLNVVGKQIQIALDRRMSLGEHNVFFEMRALCAFKAFILSIGPPLADALNLTVRHLMPDFTKRHRRLQEILHCTGVAEVGRASPEQV